MELIPIKEKLDENEEFANNPLCRDTIHMTIDYYKIVGFVPPWIGYYAKQNGNIVGSAGFKGPPVNNTIEIAYGTMEQYRNCGIGTEICKELVALALKTDATVKITARTLLEESASGRILLKNNFKFMGTVDDPDDGEVCEWIFQGKREM